MKNETLVLKPCHIVRGWNTKIIDGIGVPFPKLSEGGSESNKVLIRIDGKYSLIHDKEVHWDKPSAINALAKENLSYIEYAERSIKYYGEEIAKLKKL